MKTLRMTIGIGLLLFSCNITYSQSDEPVLDIDFNNYPGAYEDYNISKATQDFNGIESRVAGEIRGLDGPKTWPQRTKVGEGNLRAHFPALMATGRKTGFLFDKGFENTEGAVLEYRLKFSKDFQWKLGGKLPGFGGGSSYPVGCTQNISSIKNGFTTRLMWKRNGGMVVYTYFPDRNIEKCGVDLKFFSNLQTEQWYTVRQHLTLNTPGEKNGVVKMYVDDKLVYEEKDLLIRLAEKQFIKINRVVFHTYSGGSDDSDWWSTKDQFICFDDFKVWINTSAPTDIDLDDDGINDEEDNCLSTYNPDQVDLDKDGIGDACDEFIDPEYLALMPIHLEAEDYLAGGEGVTYHDSDINNRGNLKSYREEGSVDLLSSPFASNEAYVGEIRGDEWLTYACTIPKSGAYYLDVVASNQSVNDAAISVSVDGVMLDENLIVRKSGNWNLFEKSSTANYILMDSGSHTIRITVVKPGFNLDKLILRRDLTYNSIQEQKQTSLSVYPNPAKNKIYIKGAEKGDVIGIYNMCGQCIGNSIKKENNDLHEMNITEFKHGIYFVLAGQKRFKFIKQ